VVLRDDWKAEHATRDQPGEPHRARRRELNEIGVTGQICDEPR